MHLDWVLSWWNLVFVVPFGLALLYLGVYTVSGITFGEGEADLHGDFGDADADADLHADVDADHDLHVDADADANADADGDAHADADSHGGSDQPVHLAILSWLGVGRVPLSLVLMVLLLFWGSIGFIVNVVTRPSLGDGWRVALASLPAAALGTLLLTRAIVLALVRWMPLNETSAKRRHALLGAVGEAIYGIDGNFGLAGVREPGGGDFYQVACRVTDGAPPISKGSRVKLVAYGGPDGSFYVVPYDQENLAITATGAASGGDAAAASKAAAASARFAGDRIGAQSNNSRSDRK